MYRDEEPKACEGRDSSPSTQFTLSVAERAQGYPLRRGEKAISAQNEGEEVLGSLLLEPSSYMAIDSKSKHSRAVGLLVATAVLWSFGGLLIKLVFWNPMAIAGGRSILAAVVMLLVVRRNHLNCSFDQVGGAVCYAATAVLFVASTKLTTAANAIFLQYTAPIYVAILGVYFLNEKVRSVEWIVIFTAIFGMALFFFDRLTFANYWGNGLAILSGVAFAGMIVFMRKQKSAFPLGSIFLGNILVVIVCAPFMFGPAPDKVGWLALAALGILQLGLSYILYSIAIKRVTALEGVMVPIIEPILNPIWVFLFMGERPGRWAVPGGIIVIFAAATCAWLRVSKAGGPQDRNAEAAVSDKF